jgi:hypothetical protein
MEEVTIESLKSENSALSERVALQQQEIDKYSSIIIFLFEFGGYF